MKNSQSRVLDRAATQYGLVSRRQAIACGMTDTNVEFWLANSRFVAVAPNVYRVKGVPQTRRMAVMAATLTTNGWASHATSASLLQISMSLAKDPIHTTVRAQTNHPRARRIFVADGSHTSFAMRLHRYKGFVERTAIVDGIPCTDGARTLIDISPELSISELEAAFERARRLNAVSIETLADRFSMVCGRGRAGTSKIRHLLDRARPGVLDSELEIKAWQMLQRSRVIDPQRQFWVVIDGGCRYRLDFAWPDVMVAFETEGFEWHGTRSRWKQDRIRTAALERLGWRIVVATWDDVVRSPGGTLERIASALQERQLVRPDSRRLCVSP